MADAPDSFPPAPARTALLTGATGFVGGRLCARLLAQGWDVTAIVRPGSDIARLPEDARLTVSVYDGSAASLTAICAKARADVVFHVAAHVLTQHDAAQIDALVESNVRFPLHLVAAMLAAGTWRLVNTGTGYQRGETAQDAPVNLYAATKQACEDLLTYQHDAAGLSVVTLKPYTIYGAGDRSRRLVALLADAATTGSAIDLSPGEQSIDMVHVDDLADAFLVSADRLLAAGAPLAESFFVPGERLSVRELVAAVARAAGRPIDARFGGRPYHPRELMRLPPPDPTLPGWRPTRSLAHNLGDILGAAA